MKKMLLVLALIILPATSWQIWNPNTGVLKVFNGANDSTGICYEGNAKGYDGSCVNPAAPTTDWVIDHLPKQ